MKKSILLITIFSLALFLLIAGVRIYKCVQFDRNCTGYLKQAADANNTSLASEKLDKAIRYIEANNLISGYTSIFYTTPDEDLGFWYKNLKSASYDLKNIDNDNKLEQSNQLIKLRETLIDKSAEGDDITVPMGISVFPNNLFYFIILNVSALLVVLMITKIIIYLIR
jgi:hypothetical protein